MPFLYRRSALFHWLFLVCCKKCNFTNLTKRYKKVFSFGAGTTISSSETCIHFIFQLENYRKENTQRLPTVSLLQITNIFSVSPNFLCVVTQFCIFCTQNILPNQCFSAVFLLVSRSFFSVLCKCLLFELIFFLKKKKSLTSAQHFMKKKNLNVSLCA